MILLNAYFERTQTLEEVMKLYNFHAKAYGKPPVHKIFKGISYLHFKLTLILLKKDGGWNQISTHWDL